MTDSRYLYYIHTNFWLQNIHNNFNPKNKITIKIKKSTILVISIFLHGDGKNFAPPHTFSEFGTESRKWSGMGTSTLYNSWHAD